MSRRLGKSLISLVETLGMIAVLVPAMVATTTSVAHAAGPARSAVARNPRGVTVVAGMHDTALNDCNGSGTASTPNLAAAGESVNNSAFPSGVTTVRVTVPWDIADPTIVNSTPQTLNHQADIDQLNVTKQCLDAWLQAVFAHGKQPEIDFRADTMFAESNQQVLMPSLPGYTTAMTAFRSQYVSCGTSCADGGQVKVLVPWNEPDNQGQSKVGSTYDLLLYPYNNGTHLAGNSCPANPTVTNCGDVLAANLWVTDYRLFEQQGGVGGGACSGCIVPAGDFSGGDGFLTVRGGACPNNCPYLYLYNNTIAASGLRPGHWAVHPYSDTEAYQNGTSGASTRLASFAAKLQKYHYGTNTFIWLNEISVCDTPGPGTCAKYQPGQTAYVHGKIDAMNYLVNDLPLTVGAGGPQVGRIDYYCFNGGEAKCNDDWALENGPTTTTTLNGAGQTYATWANAHPVD